METSFSHTNLEADEIRGDNDDDRLVEQPPVITIDHFTTDSMMTKVSVKKVCSIVIKS